MSDQQPGFDMNALLQQAQQMSEQLMAQQQQAAATIYEGQSGGGAVKISVTGGFQFSGVTIAPSAVDPSDVEMLEDLVLAALNDAVSQIHEAGGGDGMDLGAMGDMLGGGGGGGLGDMLGGMLGGGTE